MRMAPAACGCANLPLPPLTPLHEVRGGKGSGSNPTYVCPEEFDTTTACVGNQRFFFR